MRTPILVPPSGRGVANGIVKRYRGQDQLNYLSVPRPVFGIRAGAGADSRALKHLVANESETDRNSMNSVVDETTLHPDRSACRTLRRRPIAAPPGAG